jgi:hypothetical protein
MVGIEGDIVINPPVAEVFDFVADERNEPRYNARMLRAEKLSSGPIGPGYAVPGRDRDEASHRRDDHRVHRAGAAPAPGLIDAPVDHGHRGVPRSTPSPAGPGCDGRVTCVRAACCG